jgi:hypothetical protein
VATIAGVSVAQAITPLPDLEILPYSDVQETTSKALVEQSLREARALHTYGDLPLAAARLKVTRFPWRVPLGYDLARGAVYVAYERLQRLILALTMLGGCPRVQRAWFEIVEPDLAAAAGSSGF